MEGCLPALKAEGHEVQKEHHQLVTHRPGSDLHVLLTLNPLLFLYSPLSKTSKRETVLHLLKYTWAATAFRTRSHLFLSK